MSFFITSVLSDTPFLDLHGQGHHAHASVHHGPAAAVHHAPAVAVAPVVPVVPATPAVAHVSQPRY